MAKAGAETAGEAGATGGTGDINQDTSVAGLTDISDGFGRIAVSHTGWTFVEGRAVFELKYKFIEDASLGDSSANNALASEGGPVTITIGSKTGPVNVLSTTLDSSIATETGVVLGDSNTGYIKVIGASTAKDAEGFRSIHFTVNTPDNSDLTTQTIHISGTAEGRILSRDVVYYLMPRQTMTVECLAGVPHQDHPEDYVENVAGEGVNVRITIPKMLPESMFPLIFNLESDQLSITPNTDKYPEDNMPVANGKSICDGKTSNNSFHYVRTLSYEEYKGLQETLDGMVFTCHFKTNKAASASTIYVDNTYFNKGHDSFYNYSLYRFSSLSFSANTVAANTNVNFTFYLDDGDNTRPRTVQVKLDGLLPQNSAADGWGVIDPDDDLYSYTINSGNTATLALKTISAAAGYDNTFAVTLNAFESGSAVYHEASYGNAAQRVMVSPSTHTMHAGETKTLTATTWPASVATGTVAWTSSNTGVATVDANGKVTAVSVGTARITASCSGMTGYCDITVDPIEVMDIRLDRSSLNLGLGKTRTLVATVSPSNASNKNVTWTSSDPSVATVSNTGVVTGVAYGTATITATTVDGGYTATCLVSVVPTPVEGVTLNKTATTLYIQNGTAGSETLTATVTPNDAVNKNVTWSSSNPAVATVNASGRVTAVGSGTAIITVTTEDGGYTATCTVTVRRRNTNTVTINTNNSTTSFGDNNTYTDSNGITVTVTNVNNRTNTYLELGYRALYTNNNGTMALSSSTITDFTVTNITFNYSEYNYARGTVTASTGTYTAPGNNQTTATWTGSSSNPSFSMAPRSSGGWGATYYFNRVTSIEVTYTYSD